MKGRLYVVNQSFLNQVDKKLEAEVMIPEPKGKNWYNILIDILADMFQISIGDYVFFWSKKEKSSKSQIWGVYRVVSLPYYEDCVFKVKIEKAFEFKNSISEYDILNDPYNKGDLWNILGKKFAGKKRGSTPLSPYEIEFLIQKLIDNNSDYKFYPDKNNIINKRNEIKINLKNTQDNIVINKVKDLKMEKLSLLNKDEHFRTEKVMELLFNYIIRSKETKILKNLNINYKEIYWYANYLPYSSDGKEIDYLIMESKDKKVINKIDIIEFQRDTVDIDHIERCLLYSKWANTQLARGNKITRPIVICGKYRDLEKEILELEEKYSLGNVEIYTFNIKNEEIIFEKKR